MGKRYKKSLMQRLCTFTYHRRTLSRHLSCLRRSFYEVYVILNPDTGSRK